jgi:hypothetical protein
MVKQHSLGSEFNCEAESASTKQKGDHVELTDFPTDQDLEELAQFRATGPARKRNQAITNEPRAAGPVGERRQARKNKEPPKNLESDETSNQKRKIASALPSSHAQNPILSWDQALKPRTLQQSQPAHGVEFMRPQSPNFHGSFDNSPVPDLPLSDDSSPFPASIDNSFVSSEIPQLPKLFPDSFSGIRFQNPILSSTLQQSQPAYGVEFLRPQSPNFHGSFDKSPVPDLPDDSFFSSPFPASIDNALVSSEIPQLPKLFPDSFSGISFPRSSSSHAQNLILSSDQELKPRTLQQSQPAFMRPQSPNFHGSFDNSPVPDLNDMFFSSPFPAPIDNALVSSEIPQLPKLFPDSFSGISFPPLASEESFDWWT